MNVRLQKKYDWQRIALRFVAINLENKYTRNVVWSLECVGGAHAQESEREGGGGERRGGGRTRARVDITYIIHNNLQHTCSHNLL